MARVNLVTKAQALANAAAQASKQNVDAEHAAWLRLEFLEAQANQWIKDA